ncbi:MAG TPA: type IV secretion protein IcmD [Gammaproteobacteria bacterium]|nr:type IV secretion protein IcmD [Gammaproteobacteria bacterium]HQZ87308.1 type IV secretion protein IcmD [Gammaproteobacteria bacterium]HRA42289.1 type IV secretion protein IcmD [Gammaproteobacteria bacterium]
MKLKRSIVITTVVALVALAPSILLAADITDIAKTVTTQATAIAKLLSVTAYVAGVGFALAGVLQFKTHKENPQQTPLSKPVVMIVVAACLLFLPTILTIAGASLFGASPISSAPSGAGLGGT